MDKQDFWSLLFGFARKMQAPGGVAAIAVVAVGWVERSREAHRCCRGWWASRLRTTHPTATTATAIGAALCRDPDPDVNDRHESFARAGGAVPQSERLASETG